ncbi:MAG: leucine-rich repeat protein [Oscillospiraceae bacterium]|nr:leucine-rich repeat protein [Oscillospiraceae bacterium]
MRHTIFTALICGLFAGTLCTALPVQAADEEGTVLGTAERGGVIYTIYQDHAAVSGANADLSGDVTVPVQVDGLPVTEIKGRSFVDVNITTLTLPSTVEVIRQNAVLRCDDLTEVTVLEGTTTLEYHPWQKCKKLKTLHLPASLNSVQGRIVLNCPLLTTVDVAEDNETFVCKDGMFCSKSGILYQLLDTQRQDVVLPGSITQISSYAFEDCAVQSVSMPGVTKIALYAFKNCTSLQEVELSDELKGLGTGVFYGCTSLEEVTMPENVISISSMCFENSGLRRITIPGAATGINTDFSTALNSPDVTVIYGVEGSAVEAFAEQYGYRFLPIGTDYVLGDVNADGRINANDASVTLVAAARIGAKRDSGLTRAQRYAADVTWDNAVNAVDASRILQYAAYVGAKGTKDLESYLGR